MSSPKGNIAIICYIYFIASNIELLQTKSGLLLLLSIGWFKKRGGGERQLLEKYWSSLTSGNSQDSLILDEENPVWSTTSLYKYLLVPAFGNNENDFIKYHNYLKVYLCSRTVYTCAEEIFSEAF